MTVAINTKKLEVYIKNHEVIPAEKNDNFKLILFLLILKVVHFFYRLTFKIDRIYPNSI